MAVPEMEAVLEFLRKNGLLQAETTLKDEIAEKAPLGSFDFEKFLFPMMPPPPPLKIPSRPDAGEWDKSSGLSSDDQFLSLGSSPTDASSSDFVNPYGLHSSSTPNSESSSDRLSQFGTARAYQDLDLQNHPPIFDDKSGEGHFMSPPSRASVPEPFLVPSQDKFVMTSETSKDESLLDQNIDLAYDPKLFDNPEEEKQDFGVIPYSYGIDTDDRIGRFVGELNIAAPGEYGESISKKTVEKTDLDDLKPSGDVQNSRTEQPFPGIDFFHDNENERYELDEEAEAVGDQEQDMFMLDGLEDIYEVFDLRIVHRKNRTGFEENKDIPIVLNTVVAGRYYVTEYLGSAAFSKVVQARDLHTGVDVCLKIIKNDKDFFDQSLDEIKLLKLVNKHDPADEHHILRLYDYFYHQEHLFIVCELLRANLYEYQKFNQESGGDVYFSVSRLQIITRQCLEALEYLHGLGIIHCDLKPENILIKSYRRSEIKIIDLGSSCFRSDNLCLYVQSRSYRAPEVILGLPYDEKIDLWSLGCILAELCSGEVLFPNDMVVMILARMMAMFGPIDLKMLMRGQETHKYFTEEYDLYFINEETEQVEFINPPEESSLENHLQVSDIGFIDFVRSLLEINPNRRPTAKEALGHPWLSHEYPAHTDPHIVYGVVLRTCI